MMDEPLAAEEWSHLRRLCERTVCRLPSVGEFEEWSRKLDAAQTNDELSQVADGLARLVAAYQQYTGVNILNGPTIFERIDQHMRHTRK